MPVVVLKKTIPSGHALFDTGTSVWTDRVIPGSDPPAPAGLEADRVREAAFYCQERTGAKK